MKIYYYAFAIALGLTFNSCTTDEIETPKNKQNQYQQRDATDSTAVVNTTDLSTLTVGGSTDIGLEDGEPLPPKGKDN